MSSPRYTVTFYQSEDLQGLTGPEGQRFCVFFRSENDPIQSAWQWCHTLEEAINAQAIWLQAPEEEGDA